MFQDTNAILDRLNPAQLRAVTTVDGPVLVLAGPGSGKTRVITHRIAYLLGEKHAPASSVLAVTFTNKAAREMVDRVRLLAPYQASQLTIGTFHAICARILRREGAAIGIAPTFTIADDDDQAAVIKRVLKELNWDEKRNPPRALLSRISAAKSVLIGPREFATSASDYADEQVAIVYGRYQEALAAADLLDFDDLLMSLVNLLVECPTVLERYQQRYVHVLVDEFQDTNVAQYAIVRRLGAGHNNTCVVGDEDQSVYSWRHADIRNILNFERDFPGTRVIVLEQNYRSTSTILRAARKVIAPNRQRKEKSLFTENEAGERIVVFEAYDENEEANYVASQIERLAAGQGLRLSDVAVMYRTNSQSRVFEKLFLRHRLPHKVVGMRFYERKEIRDVLSYLRLCYNHNDVTSLDRVINVPPRQIGSKTLADLRLWAARMGVGVSDAIETLATGQQTQVPCPISARAQNALAEFGRTMSVLRRASRELVVARLLDQVLERTGYAEFLKDGTEEGQARWDNVRELLTVAEEFSHYDPESSLAAFLEDVALAGDADEYDASAEAVTLITLHAAKGLEFDVVFIAGLEEGICPHSRSVEDERQLEEERRLLYVGITRARRRLFLTYAARRSQFGEAGARQPSRFFQDLPKDLVQGTARAVQGRGRDWTRPSAADRSSPTSPVLGGSRPSHPAPAPA
ncbi:MAG TPA: UvrD-helicase domain-containing protein, partial [Chloroflexota bacterium]|nr:UvrD-helicase domain-containing protein [Chloroflexota bacterium]